MPSRQPITMPTASPQIGLSWFLVTSVINAPIKVDTNVPNKSEYVFPYPANTFASSDAGRNWNHSSRNSAPKNRPKLSINPNMMLDTIPTVIEVKDKFAPFNQSETDACAPRL